MNSNAAQQLIKPKNVKSKFREQFDIEPAIIDIFEILHLATSAMDVPAFFAHIREVHSAIKAKREAITEEIDTMFVAYCKMSLLLSAVLLEGYKKEQGKEWEMLAPHGTADDREPRNGATSPNWEPPL